MKWCKKLKCGGCRHCQGKYSPKALEEKKIANHVTYADDDDKGGKGGEMRGQNANEMKGASTPRPTERAPTPRPTEGAPTPRTTRTTAPESDVTMSLKGEPSKFSITAEQPARNENQVMAVESSSQPASTEKGHSESNDLGIEYWATRSSVRSFAHTAHSFAGYTRPLRCAHLFARSLTNYLTRAKVVLVDKMKASISCSFHGHGGVLSRPDEEERRAAGVRQPDGRKRKPSGGEK